MRAIIQAKLSLVALVVHQVEGGQRRGLQSRNLIVTALVQHPKFPAGSWRAAPVQPAERCIKLSTHVSVKLDQSKALETCSIIFWFIPVNLIVLLSRARK